MIEHDRNRTTFLALVIDVLGAPPPQVNLLEATFHAGVGRALRVMMAEVPADDQTLIGNLADHFWIMVHLVGITSIQVTGQAFGFAERCGYAALWYELTTAGLTSDAWIAVLRGRHRGPSPATRSIVDEVMDDTPAC